jgi:nucleoside-diphosphate-sugar epimerase
MHVDDVARAFASLLDSEVTGAVNIASGNVVAVRSVIETVANLIGRIDLVDIGARPSQSGEPAEMAAAVERLSQEVGFEPRFDLASGLADTVHRRIAAA